MARTDYRSAFELARTHRIDMNLLHDHAPARFFATVAAFVDAVPDPDRLNLFLSALRCEPRAHPVGRLRLAPPRSLRTPYCSRVLFFSLLSD